MQKFIFCDLHIGHEDSNSEALREAIKYVRNKYEDGDEILGLGDWFHFDVGIEKCRNEPITEELLKLASEIPTRLIPGNHDSQLSETKYAELFKPIEIGEPFVDNGIWHYHGHEYDLPGWFYAATRIFPWSKTPGVLKGKSPTFIYLMVGHFIHSRAVRWVIKENEKGEKYRGILLGHTHLPLHQQAPELPFLINGGDMRDSLTFLIQDDHAFHLMHFKDTGWQDVSRLAIARHPGRRFRRRLW